MTPASAERQVAVTGDTDRRGTGCRASRSDRLAFWVFVVVELGTFVLWLSLGRTEWFHTDQWDFLAGRTAFNLEDLLAGFNSHWSTLPLLAFRALWWLFGLRSYLPYLVVVVVLHLTVAALLRVVIRRSDANRWIATTAASVFALFGSGYENIVSAFQIGFVGSLALGLTQLLLADHAGPIDRRDWLGLAAGLGSLMSSGVGVVMVGATTVALLIRGRRRAAILHGGTLGAVFALWWLTVGSDSEPTGAPTQEFTLGDVATFARIGLQAVFSSIGQLAGVGFVLAVLTIIGFLLRWARADFATIRRQAAAPLALALAGIGFLLLSGYGREGLFGVDPTEARYQHVTAALLLPALAVGLDGLARRWRTVTPLVCGLLVLGIPGNVEALADYTDRREQAHRRYRAFLLSIPQTTYATQVPAAVQPDTHSGGNREITVGWLLAGAESGRIPKPDHITNAEEETVRYHLSFLQRSGVPERVSDCRILTSPLKRHFEEGDAIAFEGLGAMKVTPVSNSIKPAVDMGYRTVNGSQLVAVLGPIDVLLEQVNPYLPITVCAVGGEETSSATVGD
jgi:hypothetical protein